MIKTSYFLEMRFLPVRSEEEMLRAAIRFSKAVATPKIARQYFTSLLALRSEMLCNRDDTISAAIQVNYVYWPNHRLLGLVTRSWPDEVFDGFSFTAPIAFQNSTGQDYPLDIWDDSIPLFAETKKSAKGCGLAEIYRAVYAALELDKLLDEEPGKFLRFTLSDTLTTGQRARLSACLSIAEKSVLGPQPFAVE